jgi:hypothetical protein
VELRLHNFKGHVGVNQEGLMMRAALFHMTTAVLLCLPMVAMLDAQTSSATQAAKPDQTVTTIVGCLVQENPNATGGERRADGGTAKANDYFVRTPTVVVPVGTTVTVGKPGTTDTTTSAGKPSKDSLYRITGLQGEQLRPHVGHRVELQGHLSSNAPDASASGVTSTKTTVDQTGRATTRVETRVDVAGVLHATALKMVSANCP